MSKRKKTSSSDSKKIAKVKKINLNAKLPTAMKPSPPPPKKKAKKK